MSSAIDPILYPAEILTTELPDTPSLLSDRKYDPVVAHQQRLLQHDDDKSITVDADSGTFDSGYSSPAEFLDSLPTTIADDVVQMMTINDLERCADGEWSFVAARAMESSQTWRRGLRTVVVPYNTINNLSTTQASHRIESIIVTASQAKAHTETAIDAQLAKCGLIAKEHVAYDKGDASSSDPLTETKTPSLIPSSCKMPNCSDTATALVNCCGEMSLVIEKPVRVIVLEHTSACSLVKYASVVDLRDRDSLIDFKYKDAAQPAAAIQSLLPLSIINPCDTFSHAPTSEITSSPMLIDDDKSVCDDYEMVTVDDKQQQQHCTLEYLQPRSDSKIEYFETISDLSLEGVSIDEIVQTNLVYSKPTELGIRAHYDHRRLHKILSVAAVNNAMHNGMFTLLRRLVLKSVIITSTDDIDGLCALLCASASTLETIEMLSITIRDSEDMNSIEKLSSALRQARLISRLVLMDVSIERERKFKGIISNEKISGRYMPEIGTSYFSVPETSDEPSIIIDQYEPDNSTSIILSLFPNLADVSLQNTVIGPLTSTALAKLSQTLTALDISTCVIDDVSFSSVIQQPTTHLEKVLPLLQQPRDSSPPPFLLQSSTMHHSVAVFPIRGLKVLRIETCMIGLLTLQAMASINTLETFACSSCTPIVNLADDKSAATAKEYTKQSQHGGFDQYHKNWTIEQWIAEIISASSSTLVSLHIDSLLPSQELDDALTRLAQSPTYICLRGPFITDRTLISLTTLFKDVDEIHQSAIEAVSQQDKLLLYRRQQQLLRQHQHDHCACTTSTAYDNYDILQGPDYLEISSANVSSAGAFSAVAAFRTAKYLCVTDVPGANKAIVAAATSNLSAVKCIVAYGSGITESDIFEMAEARDELDEIVVDAREVSADVADTVLQKSGLTVHTIDTRIHA